MFIRFKIKLFFILVKHKIPTIYFSIKQKLGLINYKDIIMLKDCMNTLNKDIIKIIGDIENAKGI